jgi:hypothetical protein
MGLNKRWQVETVNGRDIVKEIHKVVVHMFTMGDVDDPEIYAAGPIWDWQQTDMGKFVMEHSVGPPTFQSQIDSSVFGYRFVIIAELEQKKLSEFYLRWGKPTWK